MLTNGEAGIDCDDCGYQLIAKTKSHEKEIIEFLVWPDDCCDPLCPECGAQTTFESYIDPTTETEL